MEETFEDTDGATYYVAGDVYSALRLCSRLRDQGYSEVCAFGPYGCGGEEGYRVYLNPLPPPSKRGDNGERLPS